VALETGNDVAGVDSGQFASGILVPLTRDRLEYLAGGFEVRFDLEP
jgi:hypothetical protein